MTHAASRLVGLAAGLLLAMGSAWAHKGSDAYLDVQQVAEVAGDTSSAALAVRSYRFTLAVAIKDLDLLLPLDANADGKVTWGEVKAALPSITALANDTVKLEASNGALPAGTALLEPGANGCRLDWRLDGIDRRGDGAYVRMAAQPRCSAVDALALRYTLLGAQDANHRLLVAGHVGGRALLTTMSPMQPDGLLLVSALAAPGSPASAGDERAGSRWQTLRDYFVLGMQHLLQGYDHLAFLLALVLPLRLALFVAAPAITSAKGDGAPGTATTVPTVGVWWALLAIVTAFTIGHSVTLVLATMGWTHASPRWVEPAIALTIVFTALLNLRPLPWVRTDVLALMFGMVHGYGFAGLLIEAAAPGQLLPWALGGFNLGVEAGQLVAVCGWVLLSQSMVGKAWYPTLVVRGGSILLVLLAAWWFWQRVV